MDTETSKIVLMPDLMTPADVRGFIHPRYSALRWVAWALLALAFVGCVWQLLERRRAQSVQAGLERELSALHVSLDEVQSSMQAAGVAQNWVVDVVGWYAGSVPAQTLIVEVATSIPNNLYVDEIGWMARPGQAQGALDVLIRGDDELAHRTAQEMGAGLPKRLNWGIINISLQRPVDGNTGRMLRGQFTLP